MATDESPADVAAQHAAPPETDAPRAGGESPQAGAEPAASHAAKPSRGRRRAAPSATTDVTAAPPKRSRRSAASAAHIAGSQVAGAPEVTPTVDVPGAAEASPARKRPARRRGAGDAATAPTASTVTPAPTSAAEPLPAAAEIADIGVVPEVSAVPAEKPARRRTSGSRRAAAGKAPAPVPVAEAQPVAANEVPGEAASVEPAAARQLSPVRAEPRRRGGRGRRDAKPEPGPEATIGEAAAEAPAAPELVTAAPVQADTQAEEEEERGRLAGGRRTRGTTRRERAGKAAATAGGAPRRGAQLVTRRGAVELHINGQVYPPAMFFGNVDGQKEARRVASEVQRAAAHGVHVHSTLVELTCPIPPDDSVYEALDGRIQTLLDADPQGYIIPRLVFVPAPGWRRQYPNEVNHYADGTTDDPSIASDLFWREAEHALAALIEHVRRMTYADRVIGYHLERGEWFHPADGGYDRSYANREAFRAWLRAKYKTEAALRAAWFDGQVQFYTAEVPLLHTTTRPEMMFFEPRRERRWIDFLEYTSEITARRLVELSKVIKDASDAQALVSVCYGYTFEFGHTFSGHLDLARLLAAPSIDFVTGPPSYRDRQPGGAGSPPGPINSMGLHGKLWVSEDDTKTWLAPGGESPDDFNPRIDSRVGTEQVQQRAVGMALAHQTGVAWMDTWGEGWLDSDDVWRVLQTLPQRYSEYATVRRSATPEVAVVLSERSLIHVQRGETFIRRLLGEQRDMIERSGASVGFYLQTDVTERSFPTDAKLYLFLNPYRLTAEQRAAIKGKLQGGNRTLAWMYAAGVCDERGENREEAAGAFDMVGITLRQQSWNMEVGSRITPVRHPISEFVQNRERGVGVRERLNPSYYADEDNRDLTVIGEYHQSGLPSIVCKRMDGWQTVFCGEPTLSSELFRGLCRYAGVHLYLTGGEDYVFAGNGFVTVHATRDQQHTLYLPAPTALYDFAEGRIVVEDAREYRLQMRAKTTYSFFAGTQEEMRKMGLPGVERPAGRRGRTSARPGKAPAAEPSDELAAESRLVDLFVEEDVAVPLDGTAAPLDGVDAGFADDTLADDSDETAEVEPDAAAGDEASANGHGPGEERKRRRRRRGGRGRGRRGRPAEAGAEGSPDAGATAPPA